MLREPLDDIKVADVVYLNSRDRTEPALKDLQQRVDSETLDRGDKQPWPLYRDWTAEAGYLADLILRSKQQLLAEDQLFAMQQGML